MPANDDVTIGELSRRMSAMETRINQQFGNMNTRLDSLQFVSREAWTLHNTMLDVRISALEDTKKWTIRTLAASLILPMLVAVAVALIAVR